MTDVTHIPLDQDPEQLAEALIADVLPDQPLDAIRIRTAADLPDLLGYLFRRARAQEAAIEKEELIAFAEANRGTATVELIGELERTFARFEGENALGEYFAYILANMRHAVAGDYDAINLRSDRLLWLLVALSMQLASGMLDYASARAIIGKPTHRRHISSAALHYQALDYVSALETPQAANTEYIMLVAECALATGDVANLELAWIALMGSPQPRDTNAWADLIERTSAVLDRHGKLDEQRAAFAAKVRHRLVRVDDDDL
jgi:hypothetical protein